MDRSGALRSAAADRRRSDRRLPEDPESGGWNDFRRGGAFRRESGGRTAEDRRAALADRQRGGGEARAASGGVPVRRLGILLSGRGSNFEAIADRVARGELDADIAVVISNREEAAGLEAARRRGLHAVCLP